ncbi:MAG: type II toxin-antitoxin system VapC family toxin [Rhodospirillales bacterium]|nr:type II toxin-antitoxin system VapC family toxin [Rhodospirillales bacterium]
MIVDSSALIAILRREPGWEDLESKLLEAARPRLSAPTLVEARLVAIRLGGLAELEGLIETAGIEIVPFDAGQADRASQAYRRFGKGRHPAGLNYGDLFAYALAKELDEPLLFAGQDFAKTDIAPA